VHPAAWAASGAWDKRSAGAASDPPELSGRSTTTATIAATAAPTWGVYSGFELFESVARPGAEEAIDNEKYEYKPRDFAAAEAEGRSLAL